MSESRLPPASDDDLQFSTAEPAVTGGGTSAPGRACAMCGQPITSTYYAIEDHLLCPACRERLDAPVAGSKAGRFIKASLMGLGAGLVGALIWFVIRRAVHLEIGIVAILVGYLVGKAVHKGSGGKGGLGYQLLAVALTYGCIAANYMPDIFELAWNDLQEKRAAAPLELGEKAADGTPVEVPADAADAEAKPPLGVGGAIAALLLLFAIAYAVALALPFLGGAQNLIGLLIIGFALWEAWKFNARRPLPVSGPYQLGGDPTTS